MKLALGYTRVSGQSQANDGTGLIEQKEAIALWAVRHDYTVIEWFEDAGVTGELPWDKRPGMRALVERLASNNVEAIILDRLDRVARGDSRIFEDFYHIVEASNVQLWAVTDGLLTVDPDKDVFQRADFEMVRSIKQAIVKQEKAKLVGRMSLGRIRAKLAGRHVDGQHFYGHDLRKPEEKETLALMVKLRKSGLTYYAVKKELNARGIKPRSSPKGWSESSVKQILMREEEKANGPKEEVRADGEGQSSASTINGEAQS